MEGMVTWGPWGGNGGLPWNTGAFHAGRLARIRIWDGLAIDAIQFQYEHNGDFKWTDKWGGDGGAQSEIVLEKGEIVTFILGYFDKFQNYTVVKSLTLITNMHKYGPYGEEKGKLFYPPQAGKNVIAGFHGRSGQFIDCIGVYLRPIHLEINDGPTTTDIAHLNNEEGMVTWGPWGGNKGQPWNTGGLHTGSLARIRIWYGLAIDVVQFQYECNGDFHWTDKWGGGGGAQSEIVLEKGEILTFILGCFDKIQTNIHTNIQNYNVSSVVKSLTLITNMHKHGPYGEEKGKLFCLPHVGSNVIVGFHGRSGQFIDCIGVYLRQIHLEISVVPKMAEIAKGNNELQLSSDKITSWTGTLGQYGIEAQFILIFVIIAVVCRVLSNLLMKYFEEI